MKTAITLGVLMSLFTLLNAHEPAKPPPVPAPAPAQTIVEVAKAIKVLGSLLEALEAAGLAEVLRSNGPFTLFAPTDEAFETLPPGTLEPLLKEENADQLSKILKNHIVAGILVEEPLRELERVTTLGGGTLEVAIMDGKLTLGGATCDDAVLQGSNGRIYLVDKVLLPTN